MRRICLLDKNNPAAGQLPDMELAKNREEVLALSRAPETAFFFSGSRILKMTLFRR